MQQVSEFKMFDLSDSKSTKEHILLRCAHNKSSTLKMSKQAKVNAYDIAYPASVIISALSKILQSDQGWLFCILTRFLAIFLWICIKLYSLLILFPDLPHTLTPSNIHLVWVKGWCGQGLRRLRAPTSAPFRHLIGQKFVEQNFSLDNIFVTKPNFSKQRAESAILTNSFLIASYNSLEFCYLK